MSRRLRTKLLISALFAALCCTSKLRGADDSPPPKKGSLFELPNWSSGMKTLGGPQFWGDVHFFHDWRIQRNVFTGHHRLIDGRNVRHASGTLQECRDKLAEIRKERKLPAMSGKAVVFIHGVVRSSKSFRAMSQRLRQDGYAVFGFDYPSTRISIPESAEYLHAALQSLEGVDEINLVVHSMGGLVVRCYLSKYGDERIKRMVMLGVPNQGAEMANLCRSLFAYKLIFGPAGAQLVCGEDGLICGLPVPDFEFGIIAGSRGTETGWNPLIPGDDDGTVTVASTKLAGATDFATVHCVHSFLMNDPQAIEYASHFLRTGRFRKDGGPQPVPRAEKAEAVESAPASP